jgi:hypothetical protein
MAPALPLTHTCDGYYFRRICRDQELRPALCPCFKENLLYLFYGRPAYRPAGPDKAVSMAAFYPVCILLRETAVAAATRIAPFDTGAFFAGLFKDHLHPGMKVEDFLLTPTLDSPARLVSTFFRSNGDYFFSRVTILKVPPMEFEVESYQNLITEKGATSTDDRRSTVEVQHASPVALAPGMVRLVVVPSSYAQDPDLLTTICTTWAAQLATYSPHHCDPREYYAKIFDEVEKYLKQEALI